MNIDKVTRNLFTANVYGPQGARETPPVGSAPSPSKEASEARNGSVQQADAVALSENVKEMERVRELLDDVPDVREDRVQALQGQVHNGTYQVSAEDLANRLLNPGK